MCATHHFASAGLSHVTSRCHHHHHHLHIIIMVMWNLRNGCILVMAVGVVIVLESTLCACQHHPPQTQSKIIAIAYQELKEAVVRGQGATICPSSDDSSSSTSSSLSSSCPSSNKLSSRSQDDAYVALLERIEQAFGPQGLGILQVTHVPSTLTEIRKSVLSQASQLAHLSSDQLEELTVPESDYTIGWSHGKEQFGVDHETNQPIYDTRKGSFYFNPFSDPSQEQTQQPSNVFPSSEKFPFFEDQLMQLTHSMTEITLWVAALCDAYLKWKNAMTTTDITHQDTSTSSSTYRVGSIYESLQSKLNTKARLLYYYAAKGDGDGTTTMNTNNDKNDDWCGWHKDHGSLTALLPGMLIDESSSHHEHGEYKQDPTTDTPDQPAGLYIQTRNGSSVHVSLPSTSIGIQLGETVEIMSGGKLVATPHAVKSGSRRRGGTPRVGRASLAVFTQPMSDQPLPDCPITADESLRSRHRTTFGAFQQATTQAFQ
jgi:isopenicillin N synthase-like dioxygenase